MSDNSVADPGAGGDTFRTKDRAGIKTEIVGLDLTPGGGSETLMNGAMPVTNTGTFAVQADTELTTKDLDTGAGTDTQAVVGLVIAKSGGAANVSATDPLPVVVGSTTPVQIQGGANQIGKLAANSGVDIGDVDVTSSALPTGASTAAKQPALGTAGAASADVISVQGVASMTALKTDGSAVTQPVSGTVTASGPLTDIQLRASAVPVSLASLPALVAGAAQIGTVSLTPQTTGGLTTFHLVSAASTNATNVKAGAGQLYGWFIRNTRPQTDGSAGDRKVAFHNTAGTPTAGASVFFSLNLPAGGAANVFGGVGIPFSTGIAITTVTGAADADAVAVALNDLDINLFYK